MDDEGEDGAFDAPAVKGICEKARAAPCRTLIACLTHVSLGENC